jgi:hypothetical protein
LWLSFFSLFFYLAGLSSPPPHLPPGNPQGKEKKKTANVKHVPHEHEITPRYRRSKKQATEDSNFPSLPSCFFLPRLQEETGGTIKKAANLSHRELAQKIF